MSFVNKCVFGALAMFAVCGQAQAQEADCRAITDAAARLACYDVRERTSAVPPPASAPRVATPQAPVGAATAPATGAPSSRSETTTADAVRADPGGEIALVTRMRYGKYRIQLADGRMFDTTVNEVVPPEVGEKVTLRRTRLGTTFLDVSGRRSLTVRLAEPSR